MDNTNIKTLKLNVSNIKSPLSGGGPSLGRVGQGGTSKIGTLARIVRKNRISINSLVELEFQKEGSIDSSLIETNKILVGIQQQLALQSSNEQKEQKAEIQQEKREKSRGKLKVEESALEKSGKRIGKAVGKLTSKILSPIKGLFDQVLEFILTLGAGVAVNAAFEWLSKEENRKKVENAFEYVKEHWKWIAGVSAGIVLFGPAVSLISSIVSLAGALLTVGGFVASVLGAPAFLALLAIIASAGGIYTLVEAIKNKSAGGSGLRAAIEAENEKLKSLGVGNNTGEIEDPDNPGKPWYAMTVMDGPKGDRFRRIAKEGEKGVTRRITVDTRTADGLGFVATEEQRTGLSSYKTNIARLTAEKDKMDAEIRAANKAIITERNLVGVATNAAQIADFNAKKAEIEKKYNQQYIDKYGDPTFGGVFNNLNLPGREMGGPVTSGKPYLVGERGPEIFAPNIDGSVINNMRTEKIYQMISSKRKGRGGIDMITLPSITNQMPPPEIPVPQGPATEVPDISSVNMADPYRQITPMLYGITV